MCDVYTCICKHQKLYIHIQMTATTFYTKKYGCINESRLYLKEEKKTSYVIFYWNFSNRKNDWLSRIKENIYIFSDFIIHPECRKNNLLLIEAKNSNNRENGNNFFFCHTGKPFRFFSSLVCVFSLFFFKFNHNY